MGRGNVMTATGRHPCVMLAGLFELTGAAGIMIDMEEASAINLLDQLADLDPQDRREVATIVRGLSETLAEVPDGKTASHVLGVLAHLLDPA
jgi:hypothetical protein